MHPGGATILSGAERALGITPEHMRASYDTYIRHGNSSSATIFSVMDRLRHAEMDAMAPGGAGPKEHVVACAFGPGIAVEMAMLRRPMGRGARRRRTAAIVQVVAASQPVAQQSGLLTPPETESDDGSTSTGGARSEDGDDVGSKMELPPTTDAPLLDGSQQKDHPIREAFGDQDFISEALEAVELD